MAHGCCDASQVYQLVGASVVGNIKVKQQLEKCREVHWDYWLKNKMLFLQAVKTHYLEWKRAPRR